MRPFDSDGRLEALAAELGPPYGPMVLFAAATGLRPGEWIALEHRDIGLDNRLVYVRRAFRVNRLKAAKTETPRAVPLQRSALRALDLLPSPPSATSLLFPAPEGGYLDLHNWRPRHWRPAQRASGITPIRRLYDLRHTFATVALRAGLGTFELSRYCVPALALAPYHASECGTSLQVRARSGSGVGSGRLAYARMTMSAALRLS